MAGRWASRVKAKGPLLAVGLVCVLLALALFGLFRTVRALDLVLQDELRGISSACDVVRQAAQGDGPYDYEELSRTFLASVSADLRALDHIAYQAPLYGDYALNGMELFVMEMAAETDPAAQARNMEVICQAAEELEQVKAQLESDYSFLTSRARREIVPHLQRIEQLCKGVTA